MRTLNRAKVVRFGVCINQVSYMEDQTSVNSVRTEIERSMRYLIQDGEVVEVRALNVQVRQSDKTYTVAGYFNDTDKIADSVIDIDGRAKGIYYTINPVKPDLLDRARNKLIKGLWPTTSDTDIAQRKWLLVDLDPKRPSDTSSTHEELQSAIDLARTIREALRKKGWPDPVFAYSGNGVHLLYRIEAPAQDENLVKKCLEALAIQYSDDKVDVDRGVYNPSRICKVYGTTTQKGLPTEERPHRQAKIDWNESPDKLMVVPTRLLESLEAIVPDSANSFDSSSGFNLEAWIDKHNLNVYGPMEWASGGKKWVFNVCPWNQEHTNKSAYITQLPNGAIAAGCHHNSCQEHNWHSLRSLVEPEWREQRSSFRFTDYGNAERMIARHGNDLKYCPNLKKWYFWNRKRWTLDETGYVQRCAKETVRSLYQEASRIENDEKRDELISWATRSEDGRRLKEMIGLAKSEEGVAVKITDFDKDDQLLNCLNGTLDLTTGVLRKHKRSDLLTKLIPVEWKGISEKNELWEEFLNSVTDGDKELESFLQRAAGYSLLGNPVEEKLFFIHGPEASGKSTFIEAVKSVVSDYAKTADFETFLKRTHVGGARNDIARLLGARIVVSIEVEKGRKLAEGLVKSLTGQDTIACRYLYSESFEYKPTYSLWLIANDIPEIDANDGAIWRRIVRLPFENTIPEEKRDPNIKMNLTNPEFAGSAILAWLVKGCQDYLGNGLAVPESVKQSTKKFREDSDPLAAFFDEKTNINPDNKKFWISTRQLYSVGECWFNNNGENPPHSNKPFVEYLKKKGCTSKVNRVDGRQVRGWQGVELKPCEYPRM
ncbi:hypothetical protein K8I28_14180 [bacterium]|nr:hypothetical protein [bacterium]